MCKYAYSWFIDQQIFIIIANKIELFLYKLRKIIVMSEFLYQFMKG